MIIPSQHASRVARTAAGGGGGGSAFTAGEFNFNDVFLTGGLAVNTNTVTMPHGGTLAMVCNGSFEGNGYIYKNGVSQPAYNSTSMTSSGIWAYSAQYALFSVLTGDQVYFSYTASANPFGEFFTVQVKDQTFTGTVIDQHNVSKDGECFLTTAVVEHMGGLDSGLELTAMRMLREHYSSTQGYAEEIQDYYTYSPLIVNAINNSFDKETVYLEIYATVKSCESFVMASQWEQAHDLYMTMYLGLKRRFI